MNWSGVTSATESGVLVYVASHGNVFHVRRDCRQAVDGISVERARERGLVPCLLCANHLAKEERTADWANLRYARDESGLREFRRAIERKRIDEWRKKNLPPRK